MPVGEVVVLTASVVGIVASFLPWYRGSFSVLGFGGKVALNAWDAGTGAWLSMLGLVAAGVVTLVAGASAGRPAATWCWPLVLGLSVFSSVCLAVQWANWSAREDNSIGFGSFEVHSGLGGLASASAGPATGFYLGMLAVAATLLCSAWGARVKHRAG